MGYFQKTERGSERVVATSSCHVDSDGFAFLAVSLRMPMSADLLPEDVLREIFTYSLPLPVPDESHFGPRAILNLTHVCSRWRQIVLSMPHLWSTIRVSEPHSPDEVQFIHEWLSRAAGVPKTLFLGLQQGSSGDGLDSFRTIFVLYPFQKLSVFIDCYDFESEDETLIVLPNQLLEHLEELNIDQCGVTFPDDAKLPNLQSLTLSRWSLGNFQHYSTAIPWSQIRRLTLSRASAPTHLLFSILKQCLRLEYCKIERPNPRHFTPAPFGYITLPNLQLFELSIYNHPVLHAFGAGCMQRLIIPSVNILKVSSCNVDTSVYSQLIERSGGMPRLHTLTLCEPADVGILLKLLPHLESITVSRDLGDGIWQDLSTGKLGPRLKHITSPVCSVDATLDFLKIRYHNATQQHDGSVCQPHITHFQSATFLLSCGESQFRDMMWDALGSNGRDPYQCLRWTFNGDLHESDRTYSTLDDIVDD